MVNYAVIVGKLKDDPEEFETYSGEKIARFSLVCDSETGAGTNSLPISLYGEDADMVLQMCKQGHTLGVQGRVKVTENDARGTTFTEITSRQGVVLNTVVESENAAMVDFPECLHTINHVVLVGKVVDKPVKITDDTGEQYAQFVIGCEREFKNRKGERITDYIPCLLWEDSVNFWMDNCHAGQQVGFQWEIEVDYDDAGGLYFTEIVGRWATIIDRKVTDSRHTRP